MRKQPRQPQRFWLDSTDVPGIASSDFLMLSHCQPDLVLLYDAYAFQQQDRRTATTEKTTAKRYL